MLIVVKIAMRCCAMAVAFMVLYCVHYVAPQLNLLAGLFVFFVLWLAFTFAVVLLASSWVVGRAGAARPLFTDKHPPSAEDLARLRDTLRGDGGLSGGGR